MIETQEVGLTRVVLCHTRKECGGARSFSLTPRPATTGTVSPCGQLSRQLTVEVRRFPD